jgi:hypothetical protein
MALTGNCRLSAKRGQWGRSSTINKWAWWHTVDAWSDRSASLSLTVGILS